MPRVNEVQSLVLTGSPSAGTFSLVSTKHGGRRTRPIAYDATAADVQAALDAAGIETACSGGPLPGTAVVIAFAGDDSEGDLALLTIGEGAAALTTALTGTNNDLVYTARRAADKPRIAYVDPPGNNVALSVAVDSADAAKEVQTVTITGTGIAGSFRLRFDGQQTAPIAYNAAAPAILAALEGLSNIGSGDVAVNVTSALGATGGAFTVTFQGALANRDVPMIEFDNALLTGTSPAGSVAQTTAGSHAITVTLATDGSSAITSTAAQVAAAVADNDDSNDLVSVANAAGNDGTGVVTALASTPLVADTSIAGTVTQVVAGQTD